MSAATVYISESNGAGEVVTDNISNINFGSVDAPNIVAANHPIIQGERSYNKYLRFKVASLGTSTTIKDLRFWKSAGTLLTGETVYEQAFYNVGVITPYTTPAQDMLPGASNTIPTADIGSSQVDIGGSLAGTLIAPGYSGYFQFQLTTSGSTPVGPVNSKVITLQYDES